MRVIEKKIIEAIEKAITTQKDSALSMRDTVIYNGKNKVIYKLWSNSVFSVSLDKKEVCFTCCGWSTLTTKSRLNALLSAFGSGYICQKNYQFYYKDVKIEDSKCYRVENGTIKEISGQEFFY